MERRWRWLPDRNASKPAKTERHGGLLSMLLWSLHDDSREPFCKPQMEDDYTPQFD